MNKSSDQYLRRDILKLICLGSAIAGTVAIFIVNPSLSTPTLLSLGLSILLSPLVTTLERKGYSRTLAIIFIFSILSFIIFTFGFLGIQSFLNQWNLFKEKLPQEFQLFIFKLRTFETQLKYHYPFLKSIHPTDTILNWGYETSQWFVDHGPTLMGNIISSIFIIPPLTFVLLNEGRSIRKKFFQLVPNRFFESFFMITTDITTAISNYIEAKMIEATLVGLLVALGLALVKAPYAIVLGVFAGITNIVPYLGPLLGVVPPLFIAAFDTHQTGAALSVGLVYLIANLIDMMIIFPLIVAKLINLHPLLLIAVVAVGQQYYGLVGMLISIPLATALKVILHEIYTVVYEQHSSPLHSNPSSYLQPLLKKTEKLKNSAGSLQ